MTVHIWPRTTYAYHASSGDADCRFRKYYLHCRFLGKDFAFSVQIHVAQRSSKRIESCLNKLCEYRVCVPETSGRILKKFGVWATLHVSSVSLIFVRTGAIVGGGVKVP